MYQREEEERLRKEEEERLKREEEERIKREEEERLKVRYSFRENIVQLRSTLCRKIRFPIS